jgi:hypothetical protein
MRISEILPYVSPNAVHAVAIDAARGRELSAIDWLMIAFLAIVFGCSAFIAVRKHLRDNAHFAAIPRMQPNPHSAEPHVWVNTRTGVYFNEGHRWFKRTREGSMLPVSVAIASGFRAARA